VQCVPVCALAGDNVVDRSENMPWYSGPTLLEHLETVPIQPASSITAVRVPVQYVIRPDAAFRGFAGQVSGGTIRSGDAASLMPRWNKVTKTPGIHHPAATRFRLPYEVDGDLRRYFDRHPVFYLRLITPFFNRFQYRATEKRRMTN
jgi:translation elongation factor EF-1alpha